MTIYALDIETYTDELTPVLNAREFACGVLKNELGETWRFRNYKDMQKKILEIGDEARKKGKRNYTYGHYIAYDFFGIFKDILPNPNFEDFANNPFIWTYKNNSYFLDTFAFSRRSLAETARIVNMTKWEMPEQPDNIDQIMRYCEQDVNITLKFILTLKELLAELGYRPRKLLTAGQTSMTCFQTWMKRNNQDGIIGKHGKIHKSKYMDLLRKAYKGGRVQAFQQGYFPKANSKDIKADYAEIASTMKIPKLDQEKFIPNPLSWISQDALLKQCGVCRCTIKSPDEDLLLLPIRYKGEPIYPKDTLMTGHWTHEEIELAIKEGYELKQIYWSIIFPVYENKNPFRGFFKELYDLEQKENGKYKPVTKLLRNNLTAKFSQYRQNTETKFIERTELNKYMEEGWNFQASAQNRYIIKRDLGISYPRYANPMLTLMITSKGRIKLYKQLKKIKPEDRLYCDTDGIIYKGEYDHIFDIGKEMGQWKTEEKDQECKIFGPKRYWIGEKCVAAGVPKRILNKQAMEQGIINTQRMYSYSDAIRTGQIDKIGTFYDVANDITGQLKHSNIYPMELIEK